MPADGNYVGRISANVTFPLGSSAGDEVRANTLIHSDDVLEVSEATVNIKVFARGFDLVTVKRRSACVTIVDANGKQLNLVVYKDLKGYLGCMYKYLSIKARLSGIARTQPMPGHGHTIFEVKHTSN